MPEVPTQSCRIQQSCCPICTQAPEHHRNQKRWDEDPVEGDLCWDSLKHEKWCPTFLSALDRNFTYFTNSRLAGPKETDAYGMTHYGGKLYRLGR